LDASDIDENGSVTLSGMLSDVGVRDDWSDVTIDWGDGSTSTVSLDGHSLIQDTTFAPSDWLYEVMAYGGGGVGTVSQSMGEDARLIDLQLNDPGASPFSQVSVANSLTRQTYDPSVDGAIASLDFRMDSRVTSTTSADEFHLKAAVRQDGLWYMSQQFGFQANGTVRRYRAEDFSLIGTTSVHPDFSSSGSELEFGFAVQALVFNGGSPDRQFSVAIDHMDITIYDVANVRSFEVTHQFIDDGMSPGNGTLADAYSIQATVSDDDTGSAMATAAVTVNNVAPTNVAIDLAVSEYVFAVGNIQAFSTATEFTDVGVYDLHTAAWSFSHVVDDDLVQESRVGTVTQAAGSGSVSDAFTFDDPGVYTVVLTVTDDDGGTTSSEPQSFVVYDPSEGFVTGGGWIDSPAGALPASPEVSGRATFGFVSKYKEGATAPDGQTQFQLKVADFHFHSDVYDWLVVAGARAQFKGTGTINGQGNFGFVLTAMDGQVNGGGNTDKLRIKILDKDNHNTIVYDNQIGSDDDATPSTELGGGQIVIHKGGKNLEAISSDVETRGSRLNNDVLQAAKDQAIFLWVEAGVDAAQLTQLADVDVELAIFPGNKLGLASTSTNKIWLDADGAGVGWSIDGSPGGYDLLSAVSHELGHMLGFEHDVLGDNLEVDQLRRPEQLSLPGLAQLSLGFVNPSELTDSATDTAFESLRWTRADHRNIAFHVANAVPTADAWFAKSHSITMGRVRTRIDDDHQPNGVMDVETSDALFELLGDDFLGDDLACR
jgi:PKD repeat protein